jgi:hypothetical protein
MDARATFAASAPKEVMDLTELKVAMIVGRLAVIMKIA